MVATAFGTLIALWILQLDGTINWAHITGYDSITNPTVVHNRRKQIIFTYQLRQRFTTTPKRNEEYTVNNFQNMILSFEDDERGVGLLVKKKPIGRRVGFFVWKLFGCGDGRAILQNIDDLFADEE